MITNEQTRPIFVDLKDQLELCPHRWPVEGSECPYCLGEIAAVKAAKTVKFIGVDVAPCMCNGPIKFSFMQEIELCYHCGGAKPV